jgi:hypothetical protein
MERKPLQTAIYQDVIDEFQAKEGQSYNEIKYQIRAEYERRCKAKREYGAIDAPYSHRDVSFSHLYK